MAAAKASLMRRIDKSYRINPGKGIMVHYLEMIQKDINERTGE